MSTQTRTPVRGPVVDERAVRVVAASTVAVAAVVLLSGWWIVLAPLAADFTVRARGRPSWSPLARIARAQVRRLPGARRPVPARPKQFAAGIGAVVSSMAAAAALGLGAAGLARGLVAGLLVAALLEAAFGFCLGCRLRATLVAARVVDDCPECGDLSARLGIEA